MGSLAVLALLLLAGGKKPRADVQPEPEPEVPQDTPAAGDEAAGFITKVVKTGGGIIGGAKAAYAAIGALAGAVGGFAVVVGLWAVALVAGVTINKLMRPEMDKRSTWPKLWTAETGSLPWRMGRAMWVGLVLNRMPGAGSADSMRWPDLDVGYGEIRVQGYLEYILRPGESGPPDAREDFYGAREWFFARLKRFPAPPELLNVIARARQVAQAYATGVCFGASACARIAGEQLNDPPRCENLWADGLGLTGPAGDEQGGATDGGRESDVELSAAFLYGARDGVDWSKRVAFGFGGAPLLNDSMAPAIAQQLAEWTTFYGPVEVSEAGELAMAGGRYTPFGASAPEPSTVQMYAVKPKTGAESIKKTLPPPSERVDIVGRQAVGHQVGAIGKNVRF